MVLERVFYRGTGANNTYTVASGEVANIFGMKGNDTLTGNIGNDVIYGGSGNDSISGGGGDDVIFGDIGNDTLKGGEGDDSMHGGAGNDTFVYTSSDNSDGSDTIDGDAGVDTADYSAADYLSLSVGSANLTFAVGSTGPIGVMYTNIGIGYEIEIIKAGDGEEDILDAYYDTDGFSVDLSKALQKVSGLLGLKSISGFERVLGGSGNDTITGSSGNNTLNGLAGDDLIYASGGEDSLNGGEGDDTLSFVSKAFTSKEALTLDLAHGTLTYGETEVNFSEFEYLIGGKGKADVIDGSNVASGSMGFTLDLSTTKGSITMAASGYASGLSDLKGIIGFEIVYGSDGDDTITGDKGNNTFYGNEGNDELNGGLGNDAFYENMDDDDDTINGGAGNDVLYYTSEDEEFSYVSLTLEEGNDTGNLSSDRSSDDIIGIEKIVLLDSGSNDRIAFYDVATNLTITLATGSIKGLAKTAANVLTSVTGFEHVDGGNGNDKIISGDKTTAAVENEFYGFGGNDTLDGGFGDDNLFGGDGNDSLIGGAGDDLMCGDMGNDTMTDKLGNDIYEVLSDDEPSAFGTDRIVDLAGTEDYLNLQLWSDVTFDIVDGSTDKDTNKFDALKITTDNGVVIIDGFFDNTLTVNSNLHEVAANLFKAGAGCIETIIVGESYLDFDDIVAALTASA